MGEDRKQLGSAGGEGIPWPLKSSQFQSEIDKLAHVVISANLTPQLDGRAKTASHLSMDLEPFCDGHEKEFGRHLAARLEEMTGDRIYEFDEELVGQRSIRIDRVK